MTFSDIVDDPDSPQSIVVWEIRTGRKKRSFQRGNAEDWPILKYIDTHLAYELQYYRLLECTAIGVDKDSMEML